MKQNHNMNLFGKGGIIDVMFSNPDKWNEISNNDKSKHFFLINRFMSIKFPVQANQMNVNGVNSAVMLDMWQIIASQFKGVPGWIYTKTAKASKKVSKKVYLPSDELIRFYCEKNEIGRREFDHAMKLNSKKMTEFLKKIEKQIAVYER